MVPGATHRIVILSILLGQKISGSTNSASYGGFQSHTWAVLKPWSARAKGAFLKLLVLGTFPAVQRLRLPLPVQEVWIHSLVRELRLYMTHSQKKNPKHKQQKQYCNKFNKGFLKIVYIKKILKKIKIKLQVLAPIV